MEQEIQQLKQRIAELEAQISVNDFSNRKIFQKDVDFKRSFTLLGTQNNVKQSSLNPNFILDNSGNGSHLRLIGDPTVASPVDGDLWFDGTNLKFYDGSTTTNIV